MNKKIVSLFPVIFGLALSSCATGVKHEINEYIAGSVKRASDTSDFRILQLTDTHLGDKDNKKVHYDFMQLTINDAKAMGNLGLIVVTGDLFTFASKNTAKEFFAFLDSQNVPWTVCYGNHDEQCYFSVDWLTGYLNDFGSNCLYKDLQDDDIQGNCNFVINVTNQDNSIFEQVIIMDSNRYYYGSYFGYDYFKDNQIEWYKKAVAAGGGAENLMFYHIPLPEIDKAYEDGTVVKDEGLTDEQNKKIDVKREKTCPPDVNSGFFDVIKAQGKTKGMFFGHDHINTFRREYQGVIFNYGIKSTDRVYCDDDLLGGQVITIKNDHSLSFKRFFHTYSEVM